MEMRALQQIDILMNLVNINSGRL